MLVYRLIALFALALALFALGCDGTHLAGTNDVELEYEVQRGSVADDVRPRIQARLAAAQVSADVAPVDATHVRVIVDADNANTVESLLTWRGGLALYETDPTYAFAPGDSTGLTAVTAPSGNGEVERYFTGTPAALTRAVAAGHVDADHRVLVQTLDASTARTRVVKEPPALELRDLVIGENGVASDKRDLVLYVRDEAALRARLDAIGASPTVLALGRTVIAEGPLSKYLVPARGSPPRAAVVLPMGSTIYAYARAHAFKLLLASGVLPALARTGERRLPPDLAVATACVALPILLSLAWLVFVRRFDRAYPEPWWLVLATFALGGLSVVPAGLFEWACMTLSPYLNPSLMTLGGAPAAFPLALGVFTLVVGLSEEGSKLLGAWSLASHRREFDEPVDGIVYGAASSLGFAAVENIKYFAFGRLSTSIVLARTFTSIPAHLFFGAIWGYALGKKLVRPRTSVLLFFVWAALMHGAFDTLLSLDGLALGALALNLALASLFIALLRRALVHGAVGPSGREAPPSAQRAFFRVGHPALFTLSAVGMHFFAAAILLYGVAHQASGARVSLAFFVGSSALVTLLALCAHGVVTTLPLDVAVDAEGVTFAGHAVAWKDIRGSLLATRGGKAVVRLQTTGGALDLGPGPSERMVNLERVIRAHIHAGP